MLADDREYKRSADFVINEEKYEADLESLRNLQGAEVAEAPKQESEFQTLYEDLSSQKFWKSRDADGRKIDPNEFEYQVNGLAQGVRSREDVLQMLKPEMAEQFFSDFDRLKDLATSPEEVLVSEGEKDIVAIEKRANILEQMVQDGIEYHPTLPFDIQKLRFEIRAKRNTAESERLNRIVSRLNGLNFHKNETAQGDQEFDDIESEKTELEPEADRLFNSQLSKLKEMLKAVDVLLAVKQPQKAEIRRRLNAITNTFGAARRSYTDHSGMSRSLIEEAKKIERDIELYWHLEDNILEAVRQEPDTSNREKTTPDVAPVRTEKPEPKLKPKSKRRSILTPTRKPTKAIEKTPVDETFSIREKLAKPREIPVRGLAKGRVAKTPELIPIDQLAEKTPEASSLDLSQIAIPAAERIEKKDVGYGEHLRRGLSYIWNRGNEQLEESIAYHIRGEKTKEELGERRERTKIGIAASFSASILRTAMSYGGVQFGPEVIGYTTQSIYTKHERADLEAVLSPVVEGGARRVEEAGYASYQDNVRRMAERVSASRYLSPKDKAKLLGEIMRRTVTQEETRAKIDTAQAKSVAKLLSDAVTSRITRTDVGREAANSILAVTGAHVLRAPIYAGFSLSRRYREVAKDAPSETSASEHIQKIITHEFREAAKTWNGETTREKVYAGLMTLGKVLRVASFAYASRELWEYMPSMETMTSVELHDRISDALKAYTAHDDVHVMHELVRHGEVGGGVQTFGEHNAHETIGSTLPEAHVEIPMSEVSISEFTPADLAAGTVKSGDGITQALVRVIEQNPKQYGYVDSGDPMSFHLFASRLSKTMAKNDGLLKTWLTDEAKGNIIVVPVQGADGWHVGFLDANTHQEIAGQALKAFTKPEPRH